MMKEMRRQSQGLLLKKLEDIEMKRRYSLAQWHQEVMRVKDELRQMEQGLISSQTDNGATDRDVGRRHDIDVTESVDAEGVGTTIDELKDNSNARGAPQRMRRRQNAKMHGMSQVETEKLPLLLRPRPQLPSQPPLTARDRLQLNRRSFQNLLLRYGEGRGHILSPNTNHHYHHRQTEDTRLQQYLTLISDKNLAQYVTNGGESQQVTLAVTTCSDVEASPSPRLRRNASGRPREAVCGQDDMVYREQKLTHTPVNESADRHQQQQENQYNYRKSDDRMLHSKLHLNVRLPEIVPNETQTSRRERQRRRFLGEKSADATGERSMEAGSKSSVPIEARRKSSVPIEARRSSSVPIEARRKSSVPIEARRKSSVPIESQSSEKLDASDKNVTTSNEYEPNQTTEAEANPDNAPNESSPAPTKGSHRKSMTAGSVQTSGSVQVKTGSVPRDKMKPDPSIVHNRIRQVLLPIPEQTEGDLQVQNDPDPPPETRSIVLKAVRKFKLATKNSDSKKQRRRDDCASGDDRDLDEKAFYESRPDLAKKQITLEEVKSCRYLRGYDPPTMTMPRDLGEFIFGTEDDIGEENEDSVTRE